MKAVTDTQHYDGIANAINYSKDGTQYESDLAKARNEISQDNAYFSDIGTAIVAKDGGNIPDKSEMADRIEALPTGGNTLDEFFANTLEVANIPSAKFINDIIFSNKSNLVNVIMPNVENIGYYSFQRCKKLSLTSLPSGIKSIGDFAFDGCTNLSLTSLPNGINTIGGNAFRGCTGIPFLDFSDFTGIPTVSPSSFSGTTFPFYFRDQQQLDEWAATTNWSAYAGRFQIKPSEVI